jgi:hypothetical protein
MTTHRAHILYRTLSAESSLALPQRLAATCRIRTGTDANPRNPWIAATSRAALRRIRRRYAPLHVAISSTAASAEPNESPCVTCDGEGMVARCCEQRIGPYRWKCCGDPILTPCPDCEAST